MARGTAGRDQRGRSGRHGSAHTDQRAAAPDAAGVPETPDVDVEPDAQCPPGNRDTPSPGPDDVSPTAPAPQLQEQFDDAELRALSGYAKLAELLREAHGVLRGMDLDVPDRADFVRRLLVITAAARHDQDDAMRRLELFLQTVDRWRPPSP